MCRAPHLRLLLGAAALVVAGCSGGGTATPIAVPAPKPCRLLAQLAATAGTLERANLADPAAFERALQTAVARYVATVKELRPVAPANLRGDLDQLQAAVEQRRFQDAIAARTALDRYGAENCGLPAPTAPTSRGG